MQNASRAARQRYQEGLEELARSPEVAALSGKTLCIVGCTGLIGGTLARILESAEGLRLTGVARTEPVAPARRLRFIRGSVTDLSLLARLGPQDHVVYIAGPASDYRSRIAELTETQILGLNQFLMHGLGRSGFVYVSSTQVYDRSADVLCEDDAARATNQNPYSLTKRQAESLCLWHAEQRGMRTVIVRPTNLYGASTSRGQTVLAEWIREAYETRRIRPRGHPLSVRNHCCVLDVAQGILKALVHAPAGRAFNIGSDEHLTNRELATSVAEALPFPVDIEWPETATADCQRISSERARSELRYQPRHSFAELAPYLVPHLAERERIHALSA